jgi:tRNA 5-methylaminomethyl-2-thiouridine biosynthesis bifunctional protein
VLQLPKSQKEESHFRALVARHGYPENYVRFVEKPAAQQLLGQPLPGGGWFFEQGGWVNPPSLCAARISAHPFRICAQFGKDIQQLKHDGDEWIALGPTGEPLGRAPVVILANAWEASRLLAAPGLPFKRVRGQVAHLASGCIPPVDCVLSMDGYLTPTVQGMHCLGATYDFGSNELALDPDAHLQNIHRLTQMLPEAPLPLPAPPHGRVGFRTLTPDRMPIVGALPEALLSAMSHPASGSGGTPGSLGLYCFVGLGSRGVVWSALLGEYLAALLDGTPSPLPLDLARPLKPERFLKMHFSGRESG